MAWFSCDLSRRRWKLKFHDICTYESPSCRFPMVSRYRSLESQEFAALLLCCLGSSGASLEANVLKDCGRHHHHHQHHHQQLFRNFPPLPFDDPRYSLLYSIAMLQETWTMTTAFFVPMEPTCEYFFPQLDALGCWSYNHDHCNIVRILKSLVVVLRKFEFTKRTWFGASISHCFWWILMNKTDILSSWYGITCADTRTAYYM